MFSERIERLMGSLIREILAAAQRPEVISFAGGLPAAAVCRSWTSAACRLIWRNTARPRVSRSCAN
ncbi:hypothetical protein [Aquitalea magnusonii]|uniref:hypothetical protein n=1 Tax=Aquitalea magnusonii TaxID=332411 RepID=UPI001EFB654A|nr:hypothetical protein [Aquitalea magnusonii]